MGLFCFMILLFHLDKPKRIRKLEQDVKKLKRQLKGEESSMSKILSSLINQECILKSQDGVWFNGSINLSCKILDVDDDWVKVSFNDKKGERKIKIIRIELIDDIELV